MMDFPNKKADTPSLTNVKDTKTPMESPFHGRSGADSGSRFPKAGRFSGVGYT
jgi:hypothetical protein